MAKTIVGIVSSNKTDKTIVVTTHTRKTHPLYKKQYTVTKKFMAHDENNECQPGDKVSIIETKPLSARKRFTLEKIIETPKLREDTLAITKSEDEGTGQRDSKSNKEKPDAEEAAAPETKTEKAVKKSAAKQAADVKDEEASE